MLPCPITHELRSRLHEALDHVLISDLAELVYQHARCRDPVEFVAESANQYNYRTQLRFSCACTNQAPAPRFLEARCSHSGSHRYILCAIENRQLFATEYKFAYTRPTDVPSTDRRPVGLCIESGMGPYIKFPLGRDRVDFMMFDFGHVVPLKQLFEAEGIDLTPVLG